MVKKILKFSTVLLLLVTVSSCSTSRPVLNIKDEPLPTKADGSKYTKEQVRKAIIEGCTRRRWVAQVKEEGFIEASIIVRYNKAKIDIRYDESKISILYKDSSNLNYADGYIHRNYNRWIAYLYRSILGELTFQT